MIANSWGEDLVDAGPKGWPLFEYEYNLDRTQIQTVFEIILEWLEQNNGTIELVQVPNAVLATQGEHTLFGWRKNAKKYLIFELRESVFGTQVHVTAAPTLGGMSDVSTMRLETREEWALLLEELWQSMGDRQSASRVAHLRLWHDSHFDRGRRLANTMITVLAIAMTVVLVLTFFTWMLSTYANVAYLRGPSIFSMATLLVLWQLMTFAVVKRVMSDRRIENANNWRREL